MLHRVKNIEENPGMRRTHREDIFFKTRLELLAIKTKMSQMKIHWMSLIADRLDTAKGKKNSEFEDIAIETIPSEAQIEKKH